MNEYTLHHGRQEDILKDYPENHFHSCVTDPPYGLKFMGKKWDYSVPGVAEWESVLRVMRPGAFLIAFGGTRTYHRLVCNVEDAGFEIRDMMAWLYGSGFPKSHNITDELGTALKPAIEPIVLARKPIDGTVQENYDRWGTGVLNIEACRIQLNGDYKSRPNGRPSQTGLDDRYNSELANQQDDRGRWPANIQHDGSDEVMGVFPEQKSGAMKKPYEYTNTGNSLGAPAGATRQIHEASEGSAARFFYCGKTSVADREDGCDQIDKIAMAYGNQAQAQVKRGNLDHKGDSGMNTVKMRGNHWPTVKPTNLMRYYLRLVTPKGGLFLDPYMGSGSTLKAGMHEFLNGVGIDKEVEALPIAEARIQHAIRNRSGQMDIFN
jgi:DNA modification methylase